MAFTHIGDDDVTFPGLTRAMQGSKRGGGRRQEDREEGLSGSSSTEKGNTNSNAALDHTLCPP